MDYMNIILTGATNPNTIQFFTDYIIREYKKAANEGLSKDEFFSGCRMVVGWLFDELERVYNYSLTVLPYCEHPEKLNKWSCKIDLQRVSNGTHTGTMTGDGVYLIFTSFEEAEKLASMTVTTSPEPEQLKNPHSRIFTSVQGWKLFGYLQENVKNELTDYSYFFHRMQYDGLIHRDIKHSVFIDFLNDNFGTTLDGQLRPYNIVKNSLRDSFYSTAKALIKT